MDNAKWKLNTILFAVDTVLIVENERGLQKLVEEFNSVCQMLKLKVNVKKSKVVVSERKKHDVIEYRVRTECEKQCEIIQSYANRSMEVEVREKALQGIRVEGSLGCLMKGRTANMKTERALYDSKIVPTLMNESKKWAWNEGQRFRIQATEMGYLRGAWGLNRMDGESNESVYGKFGMSFKYEGMNCGVLEVVKCSTLRWSGHLERMRGDEIIKNIYMGGVDAVSVRGRHLIKWEDKML